MIGKNKKTKKVKQVSPDDVLKNIDKEKMTEQIGEVFENISKINDNQLVLQQKMKTIQENQKSQEAYFMAICNKLEITDEDIDHYL